MSYEKQFVHHSEMTVNTSIMLQNISVHLKSNMSATIDIC